MAIDEADGALISLYFDVAHNEAVDLEVIAQASLAWAGLIKELAAATTPNCVVQVDFISGTVGSRLINSVVRTSVKVALEHPWTSGALAAIAGVFLLAPVNHVADDLTSDMLKTWFAHEDSSLSEDDVDRVAKKVIELQKDQHALELKGKVFAAATADSRVKAIGTSPQSRRPPDALLVPRAQFQLHQPSYLTSEQPTEVRTVIKPNVPVTIIRPYSKAEERRWRFEDARGEFSATMRDPVFLEALRTRHTGIELGEGVQMRLDLRVKEERVGEIWHEREYDVIKVVEPNVDPQISIDFSPD